MNGPLRLQNVQPLRQAPPTNRIRIFHSQNAMDKGTNTLTHKKHVTVKPINTDIHNFYHVRTVALQKSMLTQVGNKSGVNIYVTASSSSTAIIQTVLLYGGNC